MYHNRDVVLSCTGNGSQWPKMGRELIHENATFRKSIEICASVLKPLGLDLLAAFEKDDGFSEARMAASGLASVQVTAFSNADAPPHFQQAPSTISACEGTWDMMFALHSNLKFGSNSRHAVCLLFLAAFLCRSTYCAV